jgi:hypothetical protein
MVLVPLRYAGLLVDDWPSAALAEKISFGHFESPVEWADVAVGQCVRSREPKVRNKTVRCGFAHYSEIVRVVNAGAPCPTLDDMKIDTKGLDLLVVKVGPFDAAAYCAVRPERPDRTLVGRLNSEGLGHTL